MVVINSGYNTDPNGSMVVMEQEHFRVHQGKMFRVYDSQSIASTATLTYGFKTGLYNVHIKPIILVSSADKLSLKFYKDSVWTEGTGTALSLNNFNHVLNYSSYCTCSRGVTVTTDGTEYVSLYLPGSTGVGGTSSGAGLTGDYEYVLKPNSQYMFRFTNGSNSANIASWTIVWYEALPY